MSMHELAQNKLEKDIILMLEKRNVEMSKDIDKFSFENQKLHRELQLGK